MTEISLDSIDDSGRYRQDYGDLTGIKNSISRVGLIHCLVISRFKEITSGKIGQLVAGGRRLRCLRELGHVKLYHGSTLNPEKPGFVWEDEVPEDKRKEAELDENLYGLRTQWHEEVLQVADIHALKRDLDPKWGEIQTAQILGKGYGRTKINTCLSLAKRIRAGDKEIVDSETMSDAIALLVKRKEEAALVELQKRAMPSNLGSFLDTINLDVGGPKPPSGNGSGDQSSAVTPVEVTGSPAVSGGPVTIPLTKMFVCGDFREVLKSAPDGAFDHVVTDIPYGQNPDNMDTLVNIADVEKEHQVDYCVELMEPFLELSYRLVARGGFCVFFYDLDWHEYLQATAEKIGWKVQRWPLIVYKTSACRNSAAQYNFTKNYETAMVLRRDETSVLRSQQPSSVWMGDFAAERKLYNNPFAKPFELWKWVYSAIAFTGQKVLDPFVGEMSSSRAAINCGLMPFGIELKENHFNRGIQNVKATLALVHGTNVQFT